MKVSLKKLMILLLTVILVSATFGTVSFAAANPIVHFTFDTDFKDTTGSMEGMPMGDVTITDDGVVGKCATFNSGFLRVSDSSGFNVGEQYSIAFWVELDPSTRDADSVSIVSKPHETKGSVFEVYGDPQGLELMHKYDNDMATLQTNAAGYIDCDQKWTHLVFENDGGFLTVYVDGKLANSYEMSRNPSDGGEALITSDDSLLIGKGWAGASPLSGKIDDLRIYDSILGAADIKALADAGGGSHKIVLQLLNTKMLVDGTEKPIDPNNSSVYPYSENGYTFVPIRPVIEAMGGKVAWDGKDSRADITLKSTAIKLWLNNTNAEVNGKQVTFDVPPKSVEGRIMIPIRFVAQNLGAKVDWDGNTQKITISY